MKKRSHIPPPVLLVLGLDYLFETKINITDLMFDCFM